MLEQVLASSDVFALCKNILATEYFDPEYKQVVSYVHEYYDKYSALPSLDQISAETDVDLGPRTMTSSERRSCIDEVEKFCKRKALEHAIRKAPKLIDSGNYGEVESLVRAAITVSLNRDLGISYFKDPEKRLQEVADSPPRTSLGYPSLDQHLAGGLARTEMILFSANSGGGKSITLANLAINFAKQGLNVLYITLELAENLVAGRFDTMFTGIPSSAWHQNHHTIARKVKEYGEDHGSIQIKRMPSGTNANAIRAYIKEYELTNNTVPDLLIVDYLDIMGANENVSADNVFEKDKRATEQLRDIGFEYNMFIATASQQNRGAIDATELNQGHIAGGISKVNTVDVYVSIILTDVMRQKGEIGFALLKTRNSDGVGKKVFLKWVGKTLRIEEPPKVEKDKDELRLDKIQQRKATATSLLDMMDTLDEPSDDQSHEDDQIDNTNSDDTPPWG